MIQQVYFTSWPKTYMIKVYLTGDTSHSLPFKIFKQCSCDIPSLNLPFFFFQIARKNTVSTPVIDAT
jgi:hypothetical protein